MTSRFYTSISIYCAFEDEREGRGLVLLLDLDLMQPDIPQTAQDFANALHWE